jgi:hypothetical protein
MANPQSRKSRRKRPAGKRCPRGKKLRSKVHVHKGGKRHRHLRCVPKRKRRRDLVAPVAPPVEQYPPELEQPPGAPPVPPAPPPTPGEPGPKPGVAGVPVYTGPFGRRQAERLLWRAGFGPGRGQAEALAALGLAEAVRSLTRPAGAEVLTGPEPRGPGNVALSPQTVPGHDHLWWLDRMVRTDQPLVERMTLVWHDWFSTSNDGVGQQALMLRQNALFRQHAFGSFEQLAHDVTADPAMIVWLNLNENTRWAPNENYARELMELFTLGADRGAYTEQDVRELARALTGFDFDWSDELGMHNFRYVANRHDDTAKTVFGQTGSWTWEQGVGLCVHHSMHPSFFVGKLWSYFIPTPPSTSDRAALETLYASSGYQVRPVLEAILLHPDLYTGARMIKPPVVFLAGLLRLLRGSVDGEHWIWYSEGAGQRLFYPPDVSGWDDSRWLDTSTVRGRFELVSRALSDRVLDGDAVDDYDETETPEAAVAAARAWAGGPSLTSETVGNLTAFAANALAGAGGWQLSTYRGLRQNALRHLILASPDYQTS